MMHILHDADLSPQRAEAAVATEHRLILKSSDASASLVPGQVVAACQLLLSGGPITGSRAILG